MDLSILLDFLPDDPAQTSSPVPAVQPVQVEAPAENVRIVDATNKNGIPVAVPKKYGYRERFEQKRIAPQEVITGKRSAKTIIGDFVELPEIAAADSGLRPPTGKAGFYGPGIEVDYNY